MVSFSRSVWKKLHRAEKIYTGSARGARNNYQVCLSVLLYISGFCSFSMAKFGLDPHQIRSETQRHDDSKSLGLPASREDEEVTKSLLRGVLARVGLTEDSCSSPDTRRFSCYADLNSYDGAGDNGNDIRPCPKNEQRKSKNHPAIRFPSASSISPSNSTDYCQQDLSMDDLKQDSKGHSFLVLKPLSSLTIEPGSRSDSPSRSAVSSSHTDTVSNAASSSSKSEENRIVIPCHPICNMKLTNSGEYRPAET